MRIDEVRIGFVQVECLPEALRALQPPAIPMPELVEGASYQQKLADAANGGSLSLPWFGGFGKKFWAYYVREQSDSVKAYWRALVPLQRQWRSSVKSAPPVTRVWLSFYLYPWGIAVLADIALKTSSDFKTAMGEILKVRKAARFEVEIDGETRNADIDGMLKFGRDKLRASVYGSQSQAGQIREVFSIVTVIDGGDVDVGKPVDEKGELHHALNGLAEWNSLWPFAEVKPLAECSLKTHHAVPGHVLLAAARGRAVWLPGHFRSVADYPPRLLCYHHNLAMASLQTESLCCLASDAASRAQPAWTPAENSLTYNECCRFAAGLLGRLYGPKELDIYRSSSVRAQIDARYAAAVTAIRDVFHMPKLGGKDDAAPGGA